MRFTLRTRWLAVVGVLALVALGPQALAAEADSEGAAAPVAGALNGPLIVSYIERPPYYGTIGGQPAGFLVERMRQALNAGGVDFQFSGMSVKRAISLLKEPAATPHYCSLGWYKTKERQGFAQFSAVLYRNRPLVALSTVTNAPQLAGYKTLAAAFANKELIFGRADGFSYGDIIDGLIARLKPRTDTTNPKHEQLVRMLAKGRFSYVLVAPEEVDTMIEAAGLEGGGFFSREFADIPSGEARYLMCSKLVPSATMAKIDAAIKKLFGEL